MSEPIPARGPLRLERFSATGAQLSFSYSCGSLAFNTSLWYPPGSTSACSRSGGARRSYGGSTCTPRRSLTGLGPPTVDWGPLAPESGPAFRALWDAVHRGVFAEWRWVHGCADRPPPAHAGPPGPVPDEPADAPAPPPDAPDLVVAGGGKDSYAVLGLVAARVYIGRPAVTPAGCLPRAAPAGRPAGFNLGRALSASSRPSRGTRPVRRSSAARRAAPVTARGGPAVSSRPAPERPCPPRAEVGRPTVTPRGARLKSWTPAVPA